jgi:recombination protein RecR
LAHGTAGFVAKRSGSIHHSAFFLLHLLMASLPEPITTLVTALNQLPGIGPRSAERLALHLVQSDAASVKLLAERIVNAQQRIQACTNCGALTERIPCDICEDTRRESGLVCVVERAVDIITIEKAGSYRGKFHVLNGKISPLNGVEPEDLRITDLEQRIEREPIKEIVLALGTDVEGDATSFYLAKRLRSHGIKITRIAHGIPAGSGLEYTDEVTLSRALEGRREMI